MVAKNLLKIIGNITMLLVIMAMNIVVDTTWVSSPNVIVDFSGSSYPASSRATCY